jgi:catechol 2,3-dioxygenase-like lactoylglutathione lyase family enzyme
MAMNGVDHIGLTVSRLERSIPFYRVLLDREPMLNQVVSDPHVAEIVGFEEIELGIALFEIPGSATILELLEYRKPVGAPVDMETCNFGNVHFCLIVENLDAEFARLSSAGVSFRSERPVYAPRGAWKGSKAAYLRDPDGITVELVELPAGGLARDSAIS